MDTLYEYFDIILAFISAVIWFFTRHPFMAKMMIISIFYSLISFMIDYMETLVTPYIVNNNIMSLAAYFGVLDGISVFLTIILTGFGAKQMIAFIRS